MPVEEAGHIDVASMPSTGIPAGVSSSSASSVSNVKQKDGNRNIRRMYEVWPSRSAFFFGGRCMTGGELESPVLRFWSTANLCAWTCILLPSTIFFVFALPQLWEAWPKPVLLMSILLFIMTTTFLLLACCSDPGVIPRRSLILATGSRERLKTLLGYDPLGEDNQENAKNSVSSELHQKGYRWCSTCHIVRPPRASHCRDCDSCVLRFDHHCPFVNNCVGQRNYCFFMGFTSSVCGLAFFVLPALFFWTFSGDGRGSASRGLPGFLFILSLVIGGLVAIAGLAVCGLWSYHIFLIKQGKTTKEHLKKQSLDLEAAPTSCGSRGPRLFDPRCWVDLLLLEQHQRESGEVATYRSSVAKE